MTTEMTLDALFNHVKEGQRFFRAELIKGLSTQRKEFLGKIRRDNEETLADSRAKPTFTEEGIAAALQLTAKALDNLEKDLLQEEEKITQYLQTLQELIESKMGPCANSSSPTAHDEFVMFITDVSHRRNETVRNLFIHRKMKVAAYAVLKEKLRNGTM